MKIEIKNNPFFTKNAIGIAVIALLCACFVWQIRANASLKGELNAKREEFKEAKSASKRLKKLERQIRELEEQEKITNDRVPRGEQHPLGLIRTLSDIAADIGLKNVVFAIKEEKGAASEPQVPAAILPPGINSIHLKMDFEAALAETLDFLKRAANIERVVAVEKVEIERKKEILPYQKVTLELTTYAFAAQN